MALSSRATIAALALLLLFGILSVGITGPVLFDKAPLTHEQTIDAWLGLFIGVGGIGSALWELRKLRRK